jgi:hypothetical protein
MSALRQSPICGLEGPEFPYRGEACQGHRAAGQSPPTRAASYRGGSRRSQGWRSSRTIAAKISTRGAGTRHEGVVTFGHRRGKRRFGAYEHRERMAGLGQPTPWQMDLQDSASPVMADIAGPA